MKIEEVVKRLKQEHPDEEIVFIIGDDPTSQYYVIDESPFLHAGPAKFQDKDGNEFKKSVVIVKINKNI